MHQAILVHNEEAKDRLPLELKQHPHIYTIAQSKGLEFDDILIYDFFKDSSTEEKIWRSVYQYDDSEDHSMKYLTGQKLTYQRIKVDGQNYIFHPKTIINL